MIWFAIVLLVAVTGAILWPDLAEARRGLPDQRRAPGEIVALPQGATHALWHGPARGPVIVAIHGHATPSPMWNALTPELADIGYRVLTYDLYGRGYSDNARGEQTPEFFRRQLDALLDHYGLGDDLTLLGHGLGGAIATDWAAANPGRVKRLVLIAPSGVAATNPRGLQFVRRARGIGDRLFVAVAPRVLRQRTGGTPELAALCEGELQRRGFLRAALSSLRHMGQQQEQAHRILARADVPVVAIWGDADTTVPQRAPGTLVSWNRAAKQETVAGGGHYLPVTHPDEVAVLLRDVLREDWE